MFHLCHAEDLIVNGKTYHNVRLTNADLDSDTVSIEFDDATAKPQTTEIKLTDLSAEEASKVKTIEQEFILAITFATAQKNRINSGPVAVSTSQLYKQERPAAVEEISKHPVPLVGTVLCGSSYGYLVAVEKESNDKPATAIDSKRAYCLLIHSSRTYQDNQKIKIAAYRADSVQWNGSVYQFYSDDPGTAYDFSHN
jgi:hypothetical protein